MKKIIILSFICFLVGSSPLAFAQSNTDLQTGITKSIVDWSPKESADKIDNLLQQSDQECWPFLTSNSVEDSNNFYPVALVSR